MSNASKLKNGYSFCSNEWALDKEIKSELGLLLIISSLTAENGYCFANNLYFSEIFDCDETLISRKIKKLEEKGYISIEYTKRGCEIISREIRLTKTTIHDCGKKQSTIAEKSKDNNIIINNNKNILSNDNIQKDFEKFWSLFPKQRAGSKEKAYKSFVRALNENRVCVDKLIESVNSYKNSDEVKRGFAKGCAAWINDDRFNNDYYSKQSSGFRNDDGVLY